MKLSESPLRPLFAAWMLFAFTLGCSSSTRFPMVDGALADASAPDAADGATSHGDADIPALDAASTDGGDAASTDGGDAASEGGAPDVTTGPCEALPGTRRPGTTTCGFCGEYEEVCGSDALWHVDFDVCIGAGECTPGAVETRRRDMCGTCQARHLLSTFEG